MTSNEGCYSLCTAGEVLSVFHSVVCNAAILGFESFTDMIAAENEHEKPWKVLELMLKIPLKP